MLTLYLILDDEMNSNTFNYVKHDSFFYPEIPLRIMRNEKALETNALIDSGAIISIFKPEIADYLGLPIDRGEERTSIGISGKLKVYIHNIKLEVFEGKSFECKIAFSREFKSRFNLLGRQDFFDRHLITFDERRKCTKIEEIE